MTIKSPQLIIKKLILIGVNKSYTVNFDTGINIIYGDSDTGKSSILNLIDYLLGSKKVYMYDELEHHGKYALLEVYLNGKLYTIKRNIFNPNENIEVYHSGVEGIENVFPFEYAPNYSKDAPSGHFSDFLLSSLNIPIIEIKKSPSKEDSDMVRLSFRDIFKYCYFDQDDVGSRDILDRKNGALVTKNKETFKFIHNALDTQITQVQREIGEKERGKKEIASRYNIIASFLSETRMATKESLLDEKDNLTNNINIITSELANLTQIMRSNDQENESLREIVLELEERINELLRDKVHKENQLERNFRLRKEYNNDIKKLKTSIKIKESLALRYSKDIECPLCSSIIDNIEVKKHFIEYSEDVLKKEINSIRCRIKGLSIIIQQLKEEIYLINEQLNIYNIELMKVTEHLDKSSEEFISPYVSQRDILVSELSTYKEKLDRVEYTMKIRNQLSELKIKEETLSEQIINLKQKLEMLNENAPSLEGILNEISIYLSEFLEYIPIKRPFGIRLSSKSYLPIVRDREYVDLTSGGLRTLVSIGYIVSLLKNSMIKDTNYPSLIMIDTVGKYIGKMKSRDNESEERKENNNEGLNDPKKYASIYKYLDKMSKEFIKEGKNHQIILVDNDIPEGLEKYYSKYIVKRFSNSGENGYEIGFINNAKL